VRVVEKLTAAKVRSAGAGVHADGNNLYLQVTKSGAKSWLFKFMLNGKSREMGLGPTRTIGLAEARSRAAEARRMVFDGQDPIDHRRTRRQQSAQRAALATSFEAASLTYISDRRASWSNEKHAKQWSATLETYAYPILGKMSVGEIDLNCVTRVLKPIWEAKPETASRVRQRIEAVLDYATTKGWRTGENPARWAGNLEHIFPQKGKIAPVVHHKALPWAKLPEFVKELATLEGLGAQAVLLTILTACRTGEIIGARWDEFDLEAKLWTIPAGRMKMRKAHRVPLCDAAMALLLSLRPRREGNGAPSTFVFPGSRGDSGLSNMALLKVLRRMGRPDITTHGFRSTFRDWAADETEFPSEIVEAALAHVVSNKVEAAYRRTDFFDRRRTLMDDWGSFCMSATLADQAVIAALQSEEFDKATKLKIRAGI
jgi:integrase